MIDNFNDLLSKLIKRLNKLEQNACNAQVKKNIDAFDNLMARMQAWENPKRHGSKTYIRSSGSVLTKSVLHHSRVPTLEETFEEIVKMWHILSFEETYEK